MRDCCPRGRKSRNYELAWDQWCAACWVDWRKEFPEKSIDTILMKLFDEADEMDYKLQDLMESRLPYANELGLGLSIEGGTIVVYSLEVPTLRAPVENLHDIDTEITKLFELVREKKMYELEVVFINDVVSVRLVQCGTRQVQCSYHYKLAQPMGSIKETIVLAGDEFSTNREVIKSLPQFSAAATKEDQSEKSS